MLQHIKERKHAIATETNSSSKKVMSSSTKDTVADKHKHAAAKEGLFAFYTITQPFLSIHGLYILSDKKTA
jgi:hypothetical protein